MTDTTPAALERIMERLNTKMVWPQSAMGVDVLAITHPLCREAAAVIAALGVEIVKAQATAKVATIEMEAAVKYADAFEAKLREIAEAWAAYSAGALFVNEQPDHAALRHTIARIGEKDNG